jgi:RNA polymerase sigma factor (sigma-70 family)
MSRGMRGRRIDEWMLRRERASDADLLVAASRGDDRAFDAFYGRYLASVVGFHLRRTGRHELAFDLTAETFAAVVVGLASFDPQRGSAAGWLFAIAANKLRDSARRSRVEDQARRRLGQPPLAVVDGDLERVEELASLSGEHDLQRLLGELSALEREVICAHVIDERSYEEIAAGLSTSEAVVRQRVRRGLQRLRKRLGEIT